MSSHTKEPSTVLDRMDISVTTRGKLGSGSASNIPQRENMAFKMKSQFRE